MLMHKIPLLRAFVANLKIDAIYALYPESFCDKNLAIWKFSAFCDSAQAKQFEENEKLRQNVPRLHFCL